MNWDERNAKRCGLRRRTRAKFSGALGMFDGRGGRTANNRWNHRTPYFSDITDHIKNDIDMHWFVSTPDSIEAVGFLTFYDSTNQSQCDLTAGYLTGYVSEEQNSQVFFIETECRAKGDRMCRFVGQPLEQWTEEHKWLQRYTVENMSASLQSLQEQLRLTKDRYQNLFEQFGSAIFILDLDSGRILNANQAHRN